MERATECRDGCRWAADVSMPEQEREMSEKWTPGPWSAKWSKYRENTFIVQAGMPSNRVLASFDGDGDGPDAQSLADAHMIAAAPDLYEALRAARTQIMFWKATADKVPGHASSMPFIEPSAAAIEQIDTAISRARGE